MYSNPNGTVVPTTAQNGAQGGYGSGYPPGQGEEQATPYLPVNVQSNLQGQSNAFLGQVYRFNRTTYIPVGTNYTPRFYGYGEEQATRGTPQVITNPSKGTYRGSANTVPQGTVAAPFMTASMVGGNTALFGMNSPQVMENMVMRIAQGELVDLTPQQREAIENMITGGQLQSGQYRDTQGNTQTGTTPFGTNAQGQRLDAQGNVFDASNANQATDIYGDRVVQEGAKKWVRGADGIVRRAVAKNGRWQIQKPRGGGGGGGNVAQQAVNQPAQFTGSWGVVNFNTGTG